MPEDRVYEFDGWCGQCDGSKATFTAIGSWGIVYHVREAFLVEHAFHAPTALNLKLVSGAARSDEDG